MRPATAGLARASAWAAHAAPPTPAWAILAAIGASVLLVLFGFAVALLSIRRLRGRDGDDDSGAGPSGGGGGPRRPGPSGCDSPGGDPVWWAEFEREFAVYVATREASVNGIRGGTGPGYRNRSEPTQDILPRFESFAGREDGSRVARS